MLRRNVTWWPSIPPEGASIMAGRNEEGEELGINFRVQRVFWGTEEIMVEAHAANLDAEPGEYDSVRLDLLRDGFEWYTGDEMPTRVNVE
jgi:hypothetical protein